MSITHENLRAGLPRCAMLPRGRHLPDAPRHKGTDMPKRTDISSIMIIGAGPIVIGQACEFDDSGAQAWRALREEGYRVILVNSNPATIMTDPGLADATYVEPITPEIVAKVIEASPQEVEEVLHAEVWEILTGKKKGRENDDEITIYDSVGFAVEDFSALRLTLDLAEKYDIGSQMNMVPPIKDPKNLFSAL